MKSILKNNFLEPYTLQRHMITSECNTPTTRVSLSSYIFTCHSTEHKVKGWKKKKKRTSVSNKCPFTVQPHHGCAFHPALDLTWKQSWQNGDLYWINDMKSWRKKKHIIVLCGLVADLVMVLHVRHASSKMAARKQRCKRKDAQGV